MPAPAGDFMSLLVGSGWIYIVKTLEVSGGLLLLLGRRVPLALTLLGPVVINIFLFHLLLDPVRLPLGLALLALWSVLIVRRRHLFAPLLRDEKL